MHALHTVHALPDLRVAGGRLGDGVSLTSLQERRSGCGLWSAAKVAYDLGQECRALDIQLPNAAPGSMAIVN